MPNREYTRRWSIIRAATGRSGGGGEIFTLFPGRRRNAGHKADG